MGFPVHNMIEAPRNEVTLEVSRVFFQIFVAVHVCTSLILLPCKKKAVQKKGRAKKMPCKTHWWGIYESHGIFHLLFQEIWFKKELGEINFFLMSLRCHSITQ